MSKSVEEPLLKSTCT